MGGDSQSTDPYLKAMAEMQERQLMVCRGSTYADFSAYDYALSQHSGKKRHQRRTARFREWYVSGLCAACQHHVLENATNYVFKNGQWQPCDPPRAVS